MVLVHCFGCEDVVDATPSDGDVLWCPQCDAPLLGPPTESGDRSVRWTDAGLLLAGQVEDEPVRWVRRRSGGGAVLGAAMLGMYQAIYGPVDEEQGIVVVDDEPDDDGPAELHLDEDEPPRSWIRFKE